eukprot:2977820-Pleurochrysis_carterae.AAC.4
MAWPVSDAITGIVALLWAYRMASQDIMGSVQVVQQAEHHKLVCIRSCDFFAWPLVATCNRSHAQKFPTASP